MLVESRAILYNSLFKGRLGSKTRAITDREICHSPKIATSYWFLYLVHEGIALSTKSPSSVRKPFSAPSLCLMVEFVGSPLYSERCFSGTPVLISPQKPTFDLI